MRDVLCKRGMVLAVIVLFVGTSIIPGISGDISKVKYPEINRTTSLGGSPEEEWNKTFGGSDWDGGFFVYQTNDDGYIIAGFTFSFGAGEKDVWLIKTDSSGNEEWNKTFGGGDWDEEGQSVRQTNDGGYIIAGSAYLHDDGSWELYLIKTDSSGNKLWDKTLGGSNVELGYSVLQTIDGGYILTGATSSYGTGYGDVWLIKTDSNGNEMWNKTFGGSDESSSGQSVQQTSDGGYIITGYTRSYGAGEFDVWLIKTGSSGNEEWNKTFGGINEDYGRSVQQTNDGGYIIVGETGPYFEKNLWLIKTDSSGNKQWDKTFGGSNQDWGYSVQQTSDDGGYIITGYTDSYGAGSYDVWLIKTDNSGNKAWDKTFGRASGDYGRSVQQTNDGGYIIAGETYSYGVGNGDVWLIKIAPEGNGNVDIEINGGFRVSADITNTGTGTLTDVLWSIDLEGGLIFAGEHTEGVIDELPPGETTTIKQSTLYGIGRTTITVTAGDASRQATAFILGPLVLGVQEI